jgi:lipid-A-disaccharide synthase
MPLCIALLAAEPSGDLQAAALVRQLKIHLPEAVFCGVGGKHLRAEGVDLFFDSSVWSTVGLVEALPKIPRGYLTYRKLQRTLADRRPDLTILIDAPGIQMRMAKFLAQHSLRTLYYFPPSAWNAGERRVREVHRRVSAVLATFRFNYETYRRAGLEVGYFGHPLASLFHSVSRADACSQLQLDPAGRYIALLPGSRTHEIRLMLPLLMLVARRLRQHHGQLQFLIPAATGPVEAMIARQLEQAPDWVHVFSGHSREALAASELALLTSGSASLEAALLGIPMVLAYRVNRFDYAFGRLLFRLGLLHFRWFGLPNLVLQEDVVTELLQEKASAERLTDEALRLLEGQTGRQRQLNDLARVRAALGPADAVERIGRFVSALVGGAGVQESVERAGGNLS